MNNSRKEMKNKKRNEHQILKMLKDYNNGKSGLDLFSKYGVYSTCVFELKHRYKDLDVCILTALVKLNEENRTLKTRCAELYQQQIKFKDLLTEDF